MTDREPVNLSELAVRERIASGQLRWLTNFMKVAGSGIMANDDFIHPRDLEYIIGLQSDYGIESVVVGGPMAMKDGVVTGEPLDVLSVIGVYVNTQIYDEVKARQNQP